MTDLDDLRVHVSRIEARLETAEAVLAIQALKADYGDILDRRMRHGALVDETTLDALADEAAALFTEDAQWDGGPGLGVARGREEIAARFRRPTLLFARHFFTKPRIAIDGDHASARWDVLCPCRTGDGRSWWMSGYEDDTYRREGSNWRQASMRLTTLFMAETATGFDPILG